MKRWLRRKLQNFLYWIENSDVAYSDDDCAPLASKHSFFHGDYKEFRIYQADGGHVIEVYSYRKNKDGDNALYIVRHDQQLGDEIEKILVLQQLTK